MKKCTAKKILNTEKKKMIEKNEKLFFREVIIPQGVHKLTLTQEYHTSCKKRRIDVFFVKLT